MNKLVKTDDVIIYTCDGDDLSDEQAILAFCLNEEDRNSGPQFFFVKRADKIYHDQSE